MPDKEEPDYTRCKTLKFYFIIDIQSIKTPILLNG